MKPNLNDCLTTLGIAPDNLNPKESFSRDDSIPKKSLLLVSRYFGPKRLSVTDDFNFDTTSTQTNYAMTHREVAGWQKNRIEKLKELYSTQKELLPLMIQANKTAIYNAKSSDRRKHFYYCYLLALMNSPLNIAFSSIDKLNCLRKLWRNRGFKHDRQYLAKADVCCCYGSCSLIAVHGSKYCQWHILNDENQKLFEKCNTCGWPCVILDAVQCPGHKAPARGGPPRLKQREEAKEEKLDPAEQRMKQIIDKAIKESLLSRSIPESLRDQRNVALSHLTKYQKGAQLSNEERTFLINFIELVQSMEQAKQNAQDQ